VRRAELESKHLAELHALAAEAGIERYRMLRRGELIDRLAGGEDGGERPSAAKAEPAAAAAAPAGGRERPRRRRRRRWGRRRREVRVQDLLLGDGGRQALVYGQSREACTELLRELAAELSKGRGADPIALLVDPSPEELADWKRDAPRAEIVSAGKAQHADDAVAAAIRRAEAGERITLLVDSLSRFAESFGGGEEAAELFDAGRGLAGEGSLTVVAAVERPA